MLLFLFRLNNTFTLLSKLLIIERPTTQLEGLYIIKALGKTKSKVSNETILSHNCRITEEYPRIPGYIFTKVNIYVILINIKLLKKMTPEAERFNGWAAMLGFVAAVGAYVTTGQIIPGWF